MPGNRFEPKCALSIKANRVVVFGRIWNVVVSSVPMSRGGSHRLINKKRVKHLILKQKFSWAQTNPNKSKALVLKARPCAVFGRAYVESAEEFVGRM